MYIGTIKIIAASVLSTTLGAAAGAYWMKRDLTQKYDERMAEELDATRLYYRNKEKYKTPAEAVAALVTPVEEVPESSVETKLEKDAQAAQALYQGRLVNVVPKGVPVAEVSEPAVVSEEDIEDAVDETVDPPEPSGVEVQSIFVDGEPLDPTEFDVEEEKLSRRNGVPYVISREEYDVNEFDHTQDVILTFFERDRTLTDEDERSIDDVESLIGEGNLTKFGRGSDDRNVVYIRNEARAIDYTVIRNDASYMEVVLGLTSDEDTIQHSAMPRRRQRLSD